MGATAAGMAETGQRGVSAVNAGPLTFQLPIKHLQAAAASGYWARPAGIDTCSWPTNHWPFAFCKQLVTRTQ